MIAEMIALQLMVTAPYPDHRTMATLSWEHNLKKGEYFLNRYGCSPEDIDQARKLFEIIDDPLVYNPCETDEGSTTPLPTDSAF